MMNLKHNTFVKPKYVNFKSKSKCFKVFGIQLFSSNSLIKSYIRELINKEQSPKKYHIPLKKQKEQSVKPKKPIFIINSLKLYHCYKELIKANDPREDLYLVTGSVFQNINSIDNIVKLKLSVQEITGAKACNDSLLDNLIKLYEFGEKRKNSWNNQVAQYLVLFAAEMAFFVSFRIIVILMSE